MDKRSTDPAMVKENRYKIEEILKGLYHYEHAVLTNEDPSEVEKYRTKINEGYEEALSLDRKYYLAYLKKGDLLVLDQQYDAALQVYEEGYQISKDNMLYNRIIESLMINKRYDQALEQCDTLRPKNQKLKYPHYNYTDILWLRLAEEKTALSFCKQYFKQYPITSSEDDLIQKSLLLKTWIERASENDRDLKKTITALKNYDHEEAQFTLAYWELQNNADSENAVQSYKYFLSRNPFHSQSLFELGAYYCSLGKIKKAQYYLRRAIKIDSNLIIYAHYLHYYSKLKRKNIFKTMLPRTAESLTLWHLAQIKPDYEDAQLMVPIKKGCLRKIRKQYDDLLEGADFFIHLAASDYRRLEWYSKVRPTHIMLYQYGDRMLAAYHEIFNGIKSMAPYLEDAHFFLHDSYWYYVDEYIIEKGTLNFKRHEFSKSNDTLITLFKKRADQNPDDLVFRKFLSMQYLSATIHIIDRIGSYDEENLIRALKNIKLALRYDPESSDAWCLKGRYHIFKDEQSKADKCFQKALGYNPDHFFTSYYAGKFALETLQFEKALPLLTNAIRNGYYKDLYFYRGQVNEALGNNKAAKSDYKEDIEREPLHLAGSLYHKAYTMFTKERYQTALLYAKAVLRHNNKYSKTISQTSQNTVDKRKRDDINTQNENSYSCIAAAYSRLGKNSDLIIEYSDKAISINPESLYGWCNKGLAYWNNRDFKTAIECFERSLKVDPKHIDSLNSMANCYLELGDYQTSLQYTQKCLRIDNNYFNAWIVKGTANYRLRKYDAAQKAYKKAISINPDSEKGHQGMALVYFIKKNYKKAIEIYERLVKKNPKDYISWSDKGSAHINLREFERGLQCLEKTIKLKPDYYHPYYCKACAFALMGKKNEALEMIQKTLEIDITQKEKLKKDPDLESLYNNKQFKKLVK